VIGAELSVGHRARGALDAFAALAGGKTPSLSRRAPALHASAPAATAVAEARLRSARAFLHEAVDEAFLEACRGGGISLERRAALRPAGRVLLGVPADTSML
jgi:hypothetical protein